MQARLTRSRTEVMIAGVCGGLGEYFSVDPLIVRLIFILITLSSGVGLPVYILLWILMPKDQINLSYQQVAPASEYQQMGQDAAQIDLSISVSQPAQSVQHQRVASQGVFAEVPPPSQYHFDPQTGQPISSVAPSVQPVQPAGIPSTGQTIKLEPGIPPFNVHANAPASASPAPNAASSTQASPYQQHRQRNWRRLGFIMIGLGSLVMLEHLGISMSLLVPAIMIGAGIILLKRSR